MEEYTKASETAGDIALETLEAGGPDMNMRAALGACGWRPDTGDAKAALVEWMHVDWEGGLPPEQTSSLAASRSMRKTATPISATALSMTSTALALG